VPTACRSGIESHHRTVPTPCDRTPSPGPDCPSYDSWPPLLAVENCQSSYSHQLHVILILLHQLRTRVHRQPEPIDHRRVVCLHRHTPERGGNLHVVVAFSCLIRSGSRSSTPSPQSVLLLQQQSGCSASTASTSSQKQYAAFDPPVPFHRHPPCFHHIPATRIILLSHFPKILEHSGNGAHPGRSPVTRKKIANHADSVAYTYTHAGA